MDRASNEYLRNAVLTASQEQLHLMLYDGAIRFARQGLEGIKNENWEEVFNGFTRAQKIVLEMLNSLNYEVDRPLCTRMAGLYTFIYRKLVEASANRSVVAAADALGILEYQRQTWAMLIDKLREQHQDEGAEVSGSEGDQAGVMADASSYGSLSVHG